MTRFFASIRTRLARHHQLILLAVIVGLIAGLAAVSLKMAVHLARIIVESNGHSMPRAVVALLPGLGIAMTAVFVRFGIRAPLGTTGDILATIIRKSSLVERFKLYSHMVGSTLTVGLGGSAGLETPIVITGSAIGANVGRGLNYSDRTLLLACGAAAGIAAVFNAPIAGILFAMEVLLTDVSIASIIPLVVAAVTGSLCSLVLFESEILFTFHGIRTFDYHNVPFYLLLGAFAALVSIVYGRISILVHGGVSRLSPALRVAVATAGLFLAAYAASPVLGEGYGFVKQIAAGNALEAVRDLPYADSHSHLLVFFFAGLILVKMLATALTLRAGGCGGNFAPSLFVGACSGFLFARVGNLLSPGLLPESNFTIVGMSGVLSGVMYAPLTGVFLIAEVTGGYGLILPLLLVSAVSHFIVIQFEPHSMEARELAAQGFAPSQRRDVQILGELTVRSLLETDFACIPVDCKLGEITSIVAGSKRSLFPVTNAKGGLCGVIALNEITSVLFRAEFYDSMTAASLMTPPPAVVNIDDGMYSVMSRFDTTGAWNLPVIEDGRYVGFVSKSRIFQAYRTELRGSA